MINTIFILCFIKNAILKRCIKLLEGKKGGRDCEK